MTKYEQSHNVSDIKAKVLIVAEEQQQRYALTDTVSSCGLQLIDCISKMQLLTYDLPSEIDLWMIDSQYDPEVLAIIDKHQSQKILVGFSNAPYINEVDVYAKWQRKLKRKLAETLNMPELIEKKIYERSEKDWRYVVFIGASMGGPASVKEFLDNLSPELPVTLLLAHHFSSKMINTLPRILNRHNDWRLKVINSTQSLRTGCCLIVPISNQIVCDSYGRIFLMDEPWEGMYKPSINQLFKNVSEVYGSELVGIIFSGMGDDGSLYLEQMQENNSKIWAQDPDSCASPSQPKATIDSGLCQFVGTPKQLATKLTDMVNNNRCKSHDFLNNFSR